VTGPRVVASAVVVDDDRLLLIRRRNPPDAGRWSIPGGGVEYGETLAEAVLRELAEETGLEGVCGSLIDWTEKITDADHMIFFDFFVEVLDPVDPIAGDDALEAAWVPLHDVAEWDVVESLVEFLSIHGVIETIA
jgi:ADP-ribose pyrophosphatase YjhB (NUDIX family)